MIASVHADEWYPNPANISITGFLLDFLIDALLSDVNSLIHKQQQPTGALITANLMQLVISLCSICPALKK